ncbi:putative F-box/FBD/LRR-repeat protein At5g62970 [Camellia sinensis]|uniref:putative F-box/FBD/LRR-repeat protein At5g62970 n=1 Tax=Camellia sinensis TaxID=4442 RepID=UPI00103680EF|nr:putative F-box/FBD/LRR-repeat protein At5g62970 [Camellia sinensis]
MGWIQTFGQSNPLSPNPNGPDKINRLLDLVLVHILFFLPTKYLPRNLVICKTLVVLKLKSHIQFDVPNSIYFPYLTIFHVSLIFLSNDLTQKLFSFCHVLEELSISAEIGSVKIDFIHISTKQLGNSETVVMVDKPILESLQVKDYCLAFGFANDKYWPVFPNLTHLELDVCNNFGCKNFSDLLNSVPKLDTFQFEKQFNWFEPQRGPSYVSSSLKEIEVFGIDC